jgi:hypothetical protein
MLWATVKTKRSPESDDLSLIFGPGFVEMRENGRVQTIGGFMNVVSTAMSVLAAFGLTVGLSGQAGVSPATLPTSEKQHVKGRIQIESLAARQTRIQFWLNTPTYLAKQVVLESDSFAIRQEANSGVLIESAGSVRVTGFMLGQSINNVAVLRNAEGNVLTWEPGFKLRILADGALEWGCCPRKE